MMRLWKNRTVLLQVLDILQDLGSGAYTLAMLRQRMAEKVQSGDLDDVLGVFVQADRAAEDYIRNG